MKMPTVAQLSDLTRKGAMMAFCDFSCAAFKETCRIGKK